MSAPTTGKEFLEILSLSNLVDPKRIQDFVRKVVGSGIPDRATAVAKACIQEGLISRFHAEQLLLGRHKGFFIDKYMLMDVLGAGGMGRVYRAVHTVMQRQVALKVLPKAMTTNPEVLARFLREARAVAMLDHPNIVRAYDTGVEDGNYYIVMEYVKGVSIHDYVRQNGPMPVSLACNCCCQASAGLEHAFQNGLVHRDIKPGNLLLDTNGILRLLDLGLAVFMEEKDSDPLTVASRDNVLLGTADYIAPEQALDLHDVDIRADIYSLGCTLYYMLSGTPPFPEATVAQKLLFHQMKEPRPIRDLVPTVPEELGVVLAKMMAKVRENRFGTPGAVVEALSPFIGGSEWVIGLDSALDGDSPSSSSQSGISSSSLSATGQSQSRLGGPASRVYRKEVSRSAPSGTYPARPTPAIPSTVAENVDAVAAAATAVSNNDTTPLSRDTGPGSSTRRAAAPVVATLTPPKAAKSPVSAPALSSMVKPAPARANKIPLWMMVAGGGALLVVLVILVSTFINTGSAPNNRNSLVKSDLQQSGQPESTNSDNVAKREDYSTENSNVKTSTSGFPASKVPQVPEKVSAAVAPLTNSATAKPENPAKITPVEKVESKTVATVAKPPVDLKPTSPNNTTVDPKPETKPEVKVTPNPELKPIPMRIAEVNPPVQLARVDLPPLLTARHELEIEDASRLLRVAKGGAGLSRLSYALADVKSRGVIRIDPGTWPNPVINFGPESLKGKDRDGVKFQGAGIGTIIQIINAVEPPLFQIDRTSEMVIENLVIDGGGHVGPLLEIRGGNVHGVRLKNVLIRNVKECGIRIVNGNGTANKPIVLENVTVDMLKPDPAAPTEPSKNISSYSQPYRAIHVTDDPNNSSVNLTENLHIIGCRISCPQGIGIALSQPVKGLHIENNILWNCSIGVEFETRAFEWNQFMPIKNWQVIGPWPRNLQPTPASPTTAPDVAKPMMVAGKSTSWTSVKEQGLLGLVDLSKLYNNAQNSWAMGHTLITLTENGTHALALGSDDDLILFVNGRRRFETNQPRNWHPHSNLVDVDLEKGENHLWVVSGNGLKSWGYSLALSRFASDKLFLADDQLTLRGNTFYQMDRAFYLNSVITSNCKIAILDNLFLEVNHKPLLLDPRMNRPALALSQLVVAGNVDSPSAKRGQPHQFAVFKLSETAVQERTLAVHSTDPAAPQFLAPRAESLKLPGSQRAFCGAVPPSK